MSREGKSDYCTRCGEKLPDLMLRLEFPDTTHVSASKCIENLQRRVRELEGQVKKPYQQLVMELA